MSDDVFKDPFGAAEEFIDTGVSSGLDVVTFGQFSKERKKLEGIEAQKKQNIATRAGLLKAIKGDQTISDITRAELLQSVGQINPRFKGDKSGNLLASLGKRFLSAQEGIEPIFKARQNTQALFETMFEQPGRVQTIASSSNRNNGLIR